MRDSMLYRFSPSLGTNKASSGCVRMFSAAPSPVVLSNQSATLLVSYCHFLCGEGDEGKSSHNQKVPFVQPSIQRKIKYNWERKSERFSAVFLTWLFLEQQVAVFAFFLKLYTYYIYYNIFKAPFFVLFIVLVTTSLFCMFIQGSFLLHVCVCVWGQQVTKNPSTLCLELCHRKMSILVMVVQQLYYNMVFFFKCFQSFSSIFFTGPVLK